MKKLFAVLLAVMMMAGMMSFASAEGYTIRIYSNSNSTERTTWLIEKAKEAGESLKIITRKACVTRISFPENISGL